MQASRRWMALLCCGRGPRNVPCGRIWTMTENIRPQASVLCEVPYFIVWNAIFRRLVYSEIAFKGTAHPKQQICQNLLTLISLQTCVTFERRYFEKCCFHYMDRKQFKMSSCGKKNNMRVSKYDRISIFVWTVSLKIQLPECSWNIIITNVVSV